MAFMKVAVVIAVIAVYVSQEVSAQDGLKPLGAPCGVREECDDSKCPPTVGNICCANRKIAMTSGTLLTWASSTGTCTCCETKCVMGFAHAYGATNKTESHADTYMMTCSKLH